MVNWDFLRACGIRFGLFIGLFFLMTATVHATGTGTELIEFTGGATSIFEALRGAEFVRWVCIGLFGIAVVAGFGGVISGGWATLLGCLLLLGAWTGAEPIVDTIYAAAVF